MSPTAPVPPLEVVVAGSGVGALELAVALDALAGDRVRLRLVTPATTFRWRAHDLDGPLGRDLPVVHALSEVTDPLGVEIVDGVVTAVDPDARLLRLGHGTSVPYGVAVLATGARAVPAFEHAATLWPGTDLEEAVEAIASGFAPRVLVVVPRFTRWTLPAYDLALALADRGATVGIVTPEATPLEAFGARASSAVADALRVAGIALHVVDDPDVPTAGAVRLPHGWLEADRVLALPALVGPAPHGVPTDAGGFVLTDPRHRVSGVGPRLFAIGDAVAGAVPSGGGAAAAAAEVAEEIAVLAGVPPRTHAARPLLRGILRTADGPLYLEGDPTDPALGAASREPLWSPPARVPAPWLSAHLAHLGAVGPAPGARIAGVLG